jgi:hypothetical protein
MASKKLIEIKHRLTGVVLYAGQYASLKEAVEQAVAERANLSYANLSGTRLSYANLRYANLSHADLSHADLSDADLSGANLRYANLSHADLSYARLSYAVGLSRHRVTPLLMLHDQVGKIRAYKLVRADGVGPFNGGITYEVGQTYSVANANCDEFTECGAGINLATLDWCMREWRPGYRILIAEFAAKDIAVIPIATDGKFRVHSCKIVGEKDLVEIGLVERESAESEERHEQENG